jgi:hypothetical protein
LGGGGCLISFVRVMFVNALYGANRN